MAASDLRHYTGWDIGGAHLKAAWVDEQGGLAGTGQLATPLWEGLEALEEAVPRLYLGHTTRLQIQQQFSRFNSDHPQLIEMSFYTDQAVNINNAKLQNSK